MKIQRIDPERCFRNNRLYVDYLAGGGSARDFYTHAPHDFHGALVARRRRAYPREVVAEALRPYNVRLGASGKAIQNIDRLADERTFCIITGQQAGFLGGPVYTLYKISTALRLAERCADELGVPVVPIFWLATDDHDVHEVNHAYLFGEDGEVGKVQFPVGHDGRAIEALSCTRDIAAAYERYFERLASGAFVSHTSVDAIEAAREAVPPPGGSPYGEWIARIWSALFSHRGLVIVEPRILGGAAREFFERAVELHGEITGRVQAAGEAIQAAGYDPALLSARAGTLFLIDDEGRRTRLDRAGRHGEAVVERPERYSADVLLRPVMVDSILPVLAHVLGPGEIAYHAYLKPLYELFGLDQPLLFPRKSYTVLRNIDAGRIARYGRDAEEILCSGASAFEAPDAAIPDPGDRLFEGARAGIEKAISPLGPYVEGIDPGLVKTHRRLLSQARRSLDTLRERTERAAMSTRGMSKGEYRRLVNLIMPKGRMQERIFPIPFFLALAGRGFLDAVTGAGELDDFSHTLITLETNDE